MDKGYITLKIYESVEDKRQLFKSELKNFPEFKNTDEYILGGFSALGNPSSFHNMFVRNVRKDLYKKVKPLFFNFFPDRNIEILFDRMLFRKKGKTPSRESWHRDISPSKIENDIIFGGWINFDDNSNYFSCIPYSHKRNNNKEGFSKIQKDSEEYINLEKMKIKVEVKPGYAILFFQNIIHEVLNTKLKYDSYRLFHGIRITDSNDPLYPKNNIIKNQEVPPLPSGQIPPMYAKLHWTNWLDKLEDFSNNFHENCKECIYRKSTNTTHNIIQRFMKSLKEYNMIMYEKYSYEEIIIYFPHKI